jgi:hypothetical protein
VQRDRRPRSGSAQRRAFDRAGRRRVGEASHSEANQHAEEAGENRYQQRHLERAVPRLLVDAKDLFLNGRGLPDELLLEQVMLAVAVARRAVSTASHDLRTGNEFVGSDSPG